MTAVDLRAVVIGSGRCGTAWAARELTAAGLVCGHESVFDWHPDSDPRRRLDYPGRTPSPHEPAAHLELDAESSLAAIAYLGRIPGHVAIWHVVRDPLAVIASWAHSRILDDMATPYGLWCHAHVRELAAETTTIGRAACWVARWNLRGVALCADRPSTIVHVDGDPVNRHRPDEPPLRFGDVVASSNPATVAALHEWFDLCSTA